MLPLGHFAFAYLWYAVYAAVGTRQLPVRLALVPLAIGSQFPGLLDKPLAYLDVLTYGRSFAHSVFTFAVCTLTVWWVTMRLRGRWTTESPSEQLRVVIPPAFALGYLSHLLGDTYRFLFIGDFWAARFLLYPLFPVSESPADDISPWIRLFQIYQEMESHPQLILIILALVVFVGLQLRYYLSQKGSPSVIKS